MSERELRPPKWGPVVDPAPGPWPWPQWDPIPWIWRRVPFPEGDPIPFPYKEILEKIRIQDLIALQLASLEAANEIFQAQLNAQRNLLEKQLEILGKIK